MGAMRICIVSDSHDRADPLARAVHAAKALGAEAVIHCGDLIGAQTIKPALAAGLPVHAIHGNNLGDPQAMQFQSRNSAGQLQYHGSEATLDLGPFHFQPGMVLAALINFIIIAFLVFLFAKKVLKEEAVTKK